ncbi:hypothetical protein GCM10011519_25930 [Marmoricola endophyticus]|uniref:Methyltransferase type 11 domain-containing protein n=1 Tax=Marmoricola endophyticus TaxID=2040280 RepID=A0A917BLS0_9ACTN|nr:methyltransferase domain-containing protein [Marmoricola endophyticus]GGF50768.1 hypothetical protein GCM10011519_25930 [Marmoricola endophyticus]
MTTTRDSATDQTWLWDTGRYEPTGEDLLPYGEEVVRRAAPRPGEHALDVGTGTGNLALLCAEAGARTTGLDLASRLLGVARDRAAERGVAPTWLHADAQAMPLLDEDVDVAVSVSALVLVPDAPRSAAELLRVLKPGGRAVIGGWDWGEKPLFPPEVMDVMREVLADNPMADAMDEDPGWFGEDRVRRLFADLPVDVRTETMPYRIGRVAESDTAAADFFADHPVGVAARDRLGDERWGEVQQQMSDFLSHDDGSVFVEQTALITTITKH